ncbi:MAG: hypothetical protein ACXVPN_02990 [Bacteroidia bacterium]
MRKTLLFALFFLVSAAFYAQDKGYLELAGRCVKDGVVLKGATVTVYRSGVKVTDLTTPKNGKFQFFLPYGAEYKVVFTSPGCADMFMLINTTSYPDNPDAEPIFDIDVTFFEFGKPTINYANFKNPFQKVAFDGKRKYKEDEAYTDDFIKKLYIDVEAIKKREEQLALEQQHKKELEAKMKSEAEEKQRQEQMLAEAAKKSAEEAERLKKQFEEAERQKKLSEAKNTPGEEESSESMVSKEVSLTLDKEKRNQKEKQNKAIRAVYESDLLKIVATNERTTKVAEFAKKKNDATRNEVIETLKREAETKAQSEQVMFDSKTRSKLALFNSGIKNLEMVSLIKQTAFNDMEKHYHSVKKFPDAKNYKAPGLAAITTDVEQGTFKTVYTIHLSRGTVKANYRKEKFPWGVTYYYKNDKAITEQQYIEEISPYNIAL